MQRCHAHYQNNNGKTQTLYDIHERAPQGQDNRKVDALKVE
jgi:hypothetical protein